MRLRRKWHRLKIRGRSVNWYWGLHGPGSYGWRWFRRDPHVRPTNWTANFGQVHVSIWGRRRKRSAEL